MTWSLAVGRAIIGFVLIAPRNALKLLPISSKGRELGHPFRLMLEATVLGRGLMWHGANTPENKGCSVVARLDTPDGTVSCYEVSSLANYSGVGGWKRSARARRTLPPVGRSCLMKIYRIFRFGLASELIGATEVDCHTDDCARAEMSAARHAAPALELWHGGRLLLRKMTARA